MILDIGQHEARTEAMQSANFALAADGNVETWRKSCSEFGSFCFGIATGSERL